MDSWRFAKMSSNEQAIVNGILLMVGTKFPNTIRLWRNNTGALKDTTGRLIKFGCPGSPDLLGIMRPGLFVGIEVKDRTRQSEQQKNFQAMVGSMGGIYLLVHSVDEAEEELRRRGG